MVRLILRDPKQTGALLVGVCSPSTPRAFASSAHVMGPSVACQGTAYIEDVGAMERDRLFVALSSPDAIMPWRAPGAPSADIAFALGSGPAAMSSREHSVRIIETSARWGVERRARRLGSEKWRDGCGHEMGG